MTRTPENELNSFENHRDGTARVRGDHELNATETRPTRRRAVAANSRQKRRRSAHRGMRVELGAESQDAGRGTPEALDLFLRRARLHPLQTAAEEVELAKRIETGDLEA
jgi:hypothetical protein